MPRARLLMSSVTCCSSSSCLPITWASTSRRPLPRPWKNTKGGPSPKVLHYLSTGLLHCVLAVGGKGPGTNVPSGRLARSDVFLTPAYRGRRCFGESRRHRHEYRERAFVHCNRLWSHVLTPSNAGGMIRQTYILCWIGSSRPIFRGR